MAITKPILVKRIEDVQTELQALDNNPHKSGEIKKSLVAAVKKAGTGFGKIADLEEVRSSLADIREALTEAKNIKRQNYEESAQFVEALHEVKTKSLDILTALLAGINELPDNIGEPDPKMGTTGTRSKFAVAARSLSTDEDVELTPPMLVEAFSTSSLFDDVAKGGISLAEALRKIISDTLGVEILEEKENTQDNFFQLYRVSRPANVKLLAERRSELGLSEAEVRERIAERQKAEKEAMKTEKSAAREAKKAEREAKKAAKAEKAAKKAAKAEAEAQPEAVEA